MCLSAPSLLDPGEFEGAHAGPFLIFCLLSEPFGIHPYTDKPCLFLLANARRKTNKKYSLQVRAPC